MSYSINGAEKQLSKVFCKDYDFIIPAYQRPYSWTTDQAEELFDDLYHFYQEQKNKGESDREGYFLGSIVLIKKDNEPKSEVIDGQQRLTTLTILFSAIANFYPKEQQSGILKYICEPGDITEKIEPKPRLTLRERDKVFFKNYIQDLKIINLIQMNAESLENESQKNILKNAELFNKKLAIFNRNFDQILNFASFLVMQCYLVIVSTPSQKSAFRVFSVMNSRGLDLNPTDILKAELIGKIPESERTTYTQKWEDMEIQVGRDGFVNLFSFVRMIFGKTKQQEILLEEFRKQVLTKVADPKVLIDTVIEPYLDALTIIRNQNFVSSNTELDKKINKILYWLSWMSDSDWVPAVIQFLGNKQIKPEVVYIFLSKVERLAACLFLAGYNVNQRIQRYKLIMEEVEILFKEINGKNDSNNKTIDDEILEFFSKLAHLELTQSEKEELLKALNGDVYNMSSGRPKYILLRLDSLVSDGAASYDSSILTIEHILPQTVNAGSDWANWWPDEKERKNWVHKLGNLTPLNFKRNRDAWNYEFSYKKTAYFVGNKNTSSYALTTQILSKSEWKPSDAKERQDRLINEFKNLWEI